MSRRQVARHVASLNRSEPNSIATEWEIVVLNCLHRQGRLSHEPAATAKARPDVVFTLPRDSGPVSGFVADIVTVSNKGRHQLNPFNAYKAQFLERLRRDGISPGPFTLHVNGIIRDDGRVRDTMLLLPPIHASDSVFDEQFNEFLNVCRNEPASKHEFTRCWPGVDMAVRYDPWQSYFCSSYREFLNAQSHTKNPIHNALADKAEQLRRVESSFPTGVILCSADCDLQPGSLSPGSMRAGSIIRHFLAEAPDVAFVLVLEVRRGSGLAFFTKEPRQAVHAELYENPCTDRPLDARTSRLLREIQVSMPTPVATGTRALALLDSPWRGQGWAHFGEWRMQGNSIRISARELLSVLSGIRDERIPAQGLGVPGGHRSLFDGMRRPGMVIESATVDSRPDEDDDWVTFHFREGDPAVNPFKVPDRDS